MGYWENGVFEPSYFRLSGVGEIFPVAQTDTIRALPGQWLDLYGRPLDLPHSYDPERDILWMVDTDEIHFGDGSAPCFDSEVLDAVREVAYEAYEAGHIHWHTIYVVETPATDSSPRGFVTDLDVFLARWRSQRRQWNQLTEEGRVEEASALKARMGACEDPGFQWYYPQPGEIWRETATGDLYRICSVEPDAHPGAGESGVDFTGLVHWDHEGRRGQELIRRWVHEWDRVAHPEETRPQNWVYARSIASAGL